MRKKIKDYAEIFCSIMRKHALIMPKLHRIMRKFKQFIELIIRPIQCIYMHMVKQDSKLRPIQLHLPLIFSLCDTTNLRPAITVKIKGLVIGILPKLLLK